MSWSYQPKNTNNRIFHGCQAVYVDGAILRGVQSLGISTNQNAEPFPSFGRSQQIDFFYNKPEMSVTIERIIGAGEKLFYEPENHTSYRKAYILKKGNWGMTGWDNFGYKDNNGAPGETQETKDTSGDGEGNPVLKEYDLEIVYADDMGLIGTGWNEAAEPHDWTDPTVKSNIQLKNCLITALEYSIQVDGPITESITLVTKNIIRDGAEIIEGNLPRPDLLLSRRHFFTPTATHPAEGGESSMTIFPTELISMLEKTIEGTDGKYKAYLIQGVDISANFNYSEFDDIGQWRGYKKTKVDEQNKWKYLDLPIEVTCSFKAIARKAYGQTFNKGEDKTGDIFNKDTNFPYTATEPTTEVGIFQPNEKIRIVADSKMGNPEDTLPAESSYYVWDLGARNYLTDINFSGGDASGGNVEVTMEYQNNANDFVPYRDDSTVYNYIPLKTY